VRPSLRCRSAWAVWGGAPRADQVAYLHQVSQYGTLAEALPLAPSWDRTHSAPGDASHFRPILHIVRTLEYFAFGYNFFLWQIFAIGLRNPWRFSFDRTTGDLYIADVGQDRYEEIDVAPGGASPGKGINYGWNIMEGVHCLSGEQCDQTGLTLPIFEYGHDQGCSISGGYVYRGSAIPALQGLYFFGDYCQGWVRSIRYTGGQASELTDWPTLRPGGSVLSFGEDAAGELYVLSSSGGVFKLIPAQ